jgi:hypothetical protein
MTARAYSSITTEMMTSIRVEKELQDGLRVAIDPAPVVLPEVGSLSGSPLGIRMAKKAIDQGMEHWPQKGIATSSCWVALRACLRLPRNGNLCVYTAK